MQTIGIDIGTTTISLAVYELERDEVVEAQAIQNGCFIGGGPEWERIQDASKIAVKTKKALDELLVRHPDVEVIGLTGQMHGIVYINADGKAVSPLYTWQDQRGSLSEFGGKSIVERIWELCRISVPAGYGLATHCYQLEKGNVPEEAVYLCTIPDYMGMFLTGRNMPLMHASMAASLGFFDSERGVFQSEAMEAMGIDPAMLPEVTDRLSILGYYGGIPVTVALGDSQASFLGTAGLQENTVLVNMGTGGQVSILSDRYFQTPGVEARPFLSGKYLLTGASLCGGRAYAILERFFREYVATSDQPQYERMAELAEKAAAADNPMTVTTTFNGTRVDPSARGVISGLTEENFTPGGLILGVMTGMVRELHDLYGVICAGTGIRAERVVASGNGFRKNPMLRKICQEVFGAELSLSKREEEAACGAAIGGAMWKENLGK